MDKFYDGFVFERFEDFVYHAREAQWKDKFLRLPRFHKNLKYNFDGVYSYNKRIADLNAQNRTIKKRSKLPPANATHYNYVRKLLIDTYGFRELMSH